MLTFLTQIECRNSIIGVFRGAASSLICCVAACLGCCGCFLHGRVSTSLDGLRAWPHWQSHTSRLDKLWCDHGPTSWNSSSWTMTQPGQVHVQSGSNAAGWSGGGCAKITKQTWNIHTGLLVLIWQKWTKPEVLTEIGIWRKLTEVCDRRRKSVTESKYPSIHHYLETKFG